MTAEVTAFQNTNTTARAAFYSAVTDCQHYLRLLDRHVNGVGFHRALLCEIGWADVGDWQRLRCELEEIVHRLGGIETTEEKETP